MSLRDRLSGLDLKFSRPMLYAVGIVVALLILLVVGVVWVVPAIRGRPDDGGAVAEQPSPVEPTAVPTIEVVEEASPTTEVKAEPSATPVEEATAAPVPTKPPVQPTAAPTLIPAPGGTPVAAGPSPTPLPAGGGEELPAASGGFPWLIPIGVILLIVVFWWRWRRARATS